jgi:hypothetical protein
MASTLLEQKSPVTIRSGPANPPQQKTADPRWLAPLVLIAAAALSGWVYAWFWSNSHQLWWWIGHDRHSHYMYGLDLAFDLRSGDLPRLWHDFDRLRVWGPLHAVLVALVELVGPDHRLAVLPSLAGWVMTMWFAFLIPRRMLTTGGNAAGLLAAFMVAVSPAHRAFATDVMYESLGAGLSLAAFYCYLMAVQDRTPRSGVLLGVALTALFLHKYNYWLLALFGMVGGEFIRQPRAWLFYARSLCRRECLPSWLVGELKQPLNYVALALAGGALAIAITGGGTVTLAGRHLSFLEPHNFLHLAYVALFVRVLWWWRRTGRAWSVQLPPALRNVLLWHGGAVALWFLLPKRLSYFIWYLSPANNDQPRDSVPFMHGLPYYLQGLQDDYLTLGWGLYLFAGMLLLGLLCWRACKPGSAALCCFFLVAVYLTCQHPMLKNRFMHSWIAAGWVLGAVGLVYAVQELAGRISASCRPWAAGAVCLGLMVLMSPAFVEAGHAQEGGIKKDFPVPLVIPETYLPELADAGHTTIFCNVSTRFMLAWTFIEHHHHRHFNAEIKNFKANFENNPQQIQRWLAGTASDTLVVIDIHPHTIFDLPTDEYVDLTALKQVLEQQTVFKPARRWELPEGVTITMWKREARE